MMDKFNVLKADILRYHIILLLSALSLLLSVSIPAKDKLYPGELIHLGTHRLHIHCVGQGSPAVVIDSGIGGFSLEWANIQNNLAENVRVCSYDRAGYGWSEPGPVPKTTERISSELRRLLVEARIPGAYLLVGHSFGGYNIQSFASKFPGLTAGLVLIDSSHPEKFNTEEFKQHDTAIKKTVPKYKNGYAVRMIRPILPERYPAENKQLAFRLISTMKSKKTHFK